MHLLISKLAHWLLYGSTMFFAAGAVADVGGGGASTSDAAPSSSTTSDTPSTSTDTPATTTDSAPSSLSDIVSRAAENAEKALAKPGITLDTPTTEPAKPAVEAPKTETAEAPKVEPVAEVNPLDKIGALPAEKIAAALKDAPPEVQAFLDEKGLSLDSLTQNARLAAETTQFKEMFPTIDAAKVAFSDATNFAKIDDGLAAVTDPASFDSFMSSLAEMTFLRDAQGNPIPDPNIPGAFKNNGALAKLVDFSAGVRDQNIEKLADMLISSAKDEDTKGHAEDLKAAVQFVGQFIKNGYKMPGKQTDIASLPEDVKERLAEADRLKNELASRDTKQSAQEFDAAEDSIIAETHKLISPMITDALKDVALGDTLKSTLVNMVWDKITENMTKNSLYLRQRDTLSRSAKDYAQQRVALNQNYLKPIAAKAIGDIIGQLGKPTVDANKQRHEKLDTQTTATRMEPRTSGTTLQAQPGVTSAEDIGKKALELARQSNPNAQAGDRDYFAAVMKLKKLPVSA